MSVKNTKPSFYVEIQVFENNKIVNDISFEGKKSEVIDFINFNYSKYLFKYFYEPDIKFKINNGEFQTFEELVEKEVFIL